VPPVSRPGGCAATWRGSVHSSGQDEGLELTEQDARAERATPTPPPPRPTGVRSVLARLPGSRLEVPDVLGELATTVRESSPKVDLREVLRAYEVAAEAHQGQMRRSGEPYITHPIAVATILAGMGLDTETIVAALLHDVVEDTPASREQVEAWFGAPVAHLVDGVTKLDRLQVDSKQEQQAETLRKMILAMAEDIRVLLIKLADRLHNMQTMDAMPREKQKQKAQETLDIYAPLAHRLGMQTLKLQLEDLGFRTLHPKRYDEIATMVAERQPDSEAYIAQVIEEVQQQLRDIRVRGRVTGRPKHLYSIYEKMVLRGKEFDEIHDLVGVRVIVDSVRDCYAVLGQLHAHWRPVPGRFKDYIAMPKFNLYQSLHTTVVGPDGRSIEIQIRTTEMHQTAEYGVAAHWMYKDRGSSASAPPVQPAGKDGDLGWLDAMLEWQSDVDEPGDYLESLKLDLYQDQVFVFTPQGDPRALPAGATPIDFAYAIHTEVGHRCVGARVNGRLVPLDQELTNGDTVEILTSKAEDAGPSRDWLQIATSPRARSKIRAWFNREAREGDEERGRELLSRALRRSGISLTRVAASGELDDAAAQLNHQGIESLLRAVGAGHVDAKQVARLIVQVLTESDDEIVDHDDESDQGTIRIGTSGTDRVEVEGDSSLMVKLARCCTPVPGDPIVGYVTRGRGVSVHHTACSNVADLRSEPERIIDVDWTGQSGSTFMVTVQIEALDRKHLLRDITAVLGDLHLNIISAQVATRRDRVAVLTFSFELADPAHLEHALKQVRSVDGVYDAYRVVPGMD
jgi:guanosine-3',5'-bis(diphosphate) 3'-pyrophosphohydrolase